jgi:hypothetical protein
LGVYTADSWHPASVLRLKFFAEVL